MVVTVKGRLGRLQKGLLAVRIINKVLLLTEWVISA
jgi:hypothetical protein